MSLEPVATPEGVSPLPTQRGKTDRIGRFAVSLPAPAAPGMFKFRASVEWNSLAGRRVESADVILEVPSETRPIVLVKIPQALERELGSPSETAAATRCLAAQVLRELAQTASIAYWVDAPWGNALGLRDRLERRGFPPGPILGLDPTLPRSAAERIDRLALARLRGGKWIVSKEERPAERAESREFAYKGFQVLVLKSGTSGEEAESRIYPVDGWLQVKEKVLARR